MTYVGAGAAGGIVALGVAGYITGVTEWTTLGNKVQVSGSSLLFLSLLSYIAWRSVRDEHFSWWAVPVAFFAWLGAMMRVTDIGIWNLHPLLNIASFAAMGCFALVAWGIVFRNPPVARAVPLALAIGIASVSAMAHWPELVSRTMLGHQFMSLPSAVGIIFLATGMLIDMGAKPFRGWRELFPV